MAWNPNNILRDLLKINQQLLSISGVQNGAALTSFGEYAVAENETQTGWGPFRNLKPQNVLTTILNTGVADVHNNFARVQTGTNAAGGAAIRTRAYFSYTPGVGMVVRFTNLFDTPAADSEQWIGPFSYDSTTLQPENGWAIGYKGLTFGIARFSRGVEQEFIPQASWSEDTKGALNPQLGNIYQMKLQWLGFGMQFFDSEAYDGSGAFRPIHKIDYANSHDRTSVELPSVPFTVLVRNTGNTTNITCQSPSAYVATQGEAFPAAFTTLQGYKLPLTSFTSRNGTAVYAPSSTLTLDPTGTTVGTQGFKYLIGTDSQGSFRGGGQNEGAEPFITTPSTKYLIEFDNQSGNSTNVDIRVTIAEIPIGG